MTTLADKIRAIPCDNLRGEDQPYKVAFREGFSTAKEAAIKHAEVCEQAWKDAIADELAENLKLFAILGIDKEALDKMESHSAALIVEKIGELKQEAASLRNETAAANLERLELKKERDTAVDLFAKYKVALSGVAMALCRARLPYSGAFDFDPDTAAESTEKVLGIVADNVDKMRHALKESVFLQSHYAGLLNQYDGGQRLQFADADAWMDRIDEVKAFTADRLTTD
jgi:hypothetical protein